MLTYFLWLKELGVLISNLISEACELGYIVCQNEPTSYSLLQGAFFNQANLLSI